MYRRDIHRLLEEHPRTSPEESLEGRDMDPELLERVFDLEREIGRLEGRLQLTERAESTMQAERERLLEDVRRERERADHLEAELAERRRGFWSRLFG